MEKKKGEVVAVEKKKGEVVPVEKKKGEVVAVEKAFVQEEKPVQRKKTAGRKAAGKAVKKADAHEVE